MFFLRNFKVRDASCAAGCATACGNRWRITGTETPYAETMVGRNGEKPDYGFIASCLCWGVTDFAEIMHLQHEWNRVRGRQFRMGESIGFLMDMYEKGEYHRDGTSWSGQVRRAKLLWGDIETVDFITESVVKKKNRLYDIVRGGVYQTACMIEKLKGVPVVQYANYGGKIHRNRRHPE